MKIGLFSDVHFCHSDDLGLGRRPLLAIERLKATMRDFRDAGVEACFCLGDMLDRAEGDSKDEILGYLRECVSIIRQFDVPFYLVPGNHDFLVLSREDFKREGVTLAPFSRKLGDSAVIALDANYRASGEHFDVAGEKWDDAHVTDEQLKMFDSALSDATGDCYVLIHENLDPCVDFSHQIRNADEVRDVISKHSDKVKKVLQGHFHWGSDNKVDSIPYHTVKSMCVFDTDYYEIIEI